MSNDLKLNIELYPTGTGIQAANGLSEFYVSGESKLRVVVENAGGGNVIVVQAKINLEASWENIQTLTGPGSYSVNVSTYDSVRFNVTTYSASGTERVVVCSFNEASGSASIGVPAGGTVEGDPIQFTSTGVTVLITKTSPDTVNFEVAAAAGNAFGTMNVPNGTDPVADSLSDTLNWTGTDNTIEITGDAVTDTVDLGLNLSIEAADAGEFIVDLSKESDGLKAQFNLANLTTALDLPKYAQTFVVADWVGPTLGLYSITVVEGTHLKGLNTLIETFELNGSSYEEVVVGTIVDNTGAVTISVNSTPDLRFDGKIIIS